MGVSFKKSGDLGVLTIENAGKYNAMNQQMFRELDTAIYECEKDDKISFIILTGSGANFCAGFDVGELYSLAISCDRQLADKFIKELREIIEHLASSQKTTIAVIDGYCLGGGLELALACNARVASENAKFGFPEIDLGVIPGLGGTQRLPRLIGASEALVILAGGRSRRVSARRAEELGIVDRVLVPQSSDTFVKMAKDYVEGIRNGKNTYRKIPDKIKVGFRRQIAESVFSASKDKSAHASRNIFFAVLGAGETLKTGLSIEHELFLDVLFSDEARIEMGKFLKVEDVPVPELESRDADRDLMLLKFLREFIRKEILPNVQAMEENREIPRELMRKMAELGLLGISFPEEYGGQGMGASITCIVAEEIARVHASAAVFFGAHTALACGAVNIGGNESQKQKYLVPGIKGEKIGAFALTDESGGSDVAGMKTSAKKEGSCWVLNGSKQFITNGTIADFVVVFAQTDPLGGNKTIAAFIIDRETPGFIAESVGKKVGLDASDTATLYFDNVRVPKENVLGEIGQGFKIAMTALNGSRLGLSAVALGEAKEAFELASQYSASRKVLGEPLYMQQTIQNYLVDMSISIFAMEAFLRSVASKVEAGGDARREIAEAKVFCTSEAMKVIDTALQIFGGMGYMDETPVSRIWRDARVNLIFDGTNEVNKLLAAKEIIRNLVLGQSALRRS